MDKNERRIRTEDDETRRMRINMAMLRRVYGELRKVAVISDEHVKIVHLEAIIRNITHSAMFPLNY